MSVIKCRIRVVDDPDPAKTAMLKDLQIPSSKSNKNVILMDCSLNSKVLINALFVVKTNNSIAISFLGQPPIHLELDELVWSEINRVLNQ